MLVKLSGSEPVTLLQELLLVEDLAVEVPFDKLASLAQGKEALFLLFKHDDLGRVLHLVAHLSSCFETVGDQGTTTGDIDLSLCHDG